MPAPRFYPVRTSTLVALGCLIGLLCLTCLTGCKGLPPLENRPPSQALTYDDSLDTPLGVTLTPQLEQHPELSGIYPLADGLDAFAARVLLAGVAEVEEALYYSILPTATPYSRNAIFSGKFPDDIAEMYPDWWSRESEGSLNAFEDELFLRQIREVFGERLPVHYEKVFSASDGEQLLHRLPAYFSKPGVKCSPTN